MLLRQGVLTGGTWCVDRNKLLDFWPSEDEVAEIISVDVQGGGSGCNLAIDMKKLDPDIPVAAIGVVGDDEDGRFLLSQADAHGIERQLHMTDRAATHYVDAYTSRRTHRRTHITFQGTSSVLTPDHFSFEGRSERIFHLGLPGVHEIMDRAWGGEVNGWVATLKKARAAGFVVNLELASVADERNAELVRPCLPHLDLLVVNDREIGALSARTVVRDGATDVASCLAAAKAVLDAGAMRIAVAHFPLGAVAVSSDGDAMIVPSVKVPPEAAVGANGAGDAFAAGFLYGFHEAWTLSDALRLAHAAAAASLRSISTTGAVEPWRRCLEIAADWGWRETPS